MDYTNEYISLHPGLHIEDAQYKLHDLRMELSKLKSDVRSVLDIGCGAGAVTYELTTQDFLMANVVGVDVSTYMISQAQSAFGSERISYIASDCYDYLAKQNENAFEIGYCADLIEHLKDDIFFLNEVGRVCQTFVVRVPLEDSTFNKILRLFGKDEYRRTEDLFGHVHHYSMNELSCKVAKAGMVLHSYSLSPILKPRSSRLNEIGREMGMLAGVVSKNIEISFAGGFAVLTIRKASRN